MMMFYKYFFLVTVFISIQSIAQTEIKIQDTLTLEKSINKKINDAINLYQKYEYKKALAIAKQCIKESDSIKNDSLLGKSYILNGIIDSYLGDKNQAIQNHKKAVAIFSRTKNYKMLGIAYHNTAFSYSKNNKNTDSVIMYYKKALKSYEYLGNTEKMALTTVNLGKNYLKINDLERAEMSLSKSVQLAKIHNRKVVLSRAYERYAELYYKKNNLHKALEYLNLSQEIAEKEDYERDLILIYKLKSTILEKLGNIKEAQINLIKYNEYLELTHKIEKSRLIQEASVKFEVKENKALLERKKTENNAKENKIKKSREIIFFTAILFLIFTIASLLLYKNNRLKLENNKLLEIKNEELKNLQLQTELNFLKTQIQPHFFFNTLNNLHSLILKKSNKAEDVVLKLSELMQYTLYGSNNKNVSLLDEINNIQNYLELESLRYEKKIFSSINIEGKIDGILVPPLLYTPFIENCFKHSNVADDNFNLTISFSNIDSKYLLFKVTNPLDIPFKNIKEEKKGVGIENIDRRLKLIYKDEYDLDISTENNTFSIDLKIPIQY